MKIRTIVFIIAFFLLDDVQNVPAITPRTARTIPVHPVTPSKVSPGSPITPRTARTIPVHPVTPSKASPGSPITPSNHSWWHSTSSARSTYFTSSYSPSFTTYKPPSWFGSSTGQLFLRIFLYVLGIFLVSKIFGAICKSRKPNILPNKGNPVGVENKMYVSTINGQREEPPPTYAEIHKV